MKAPIVGEPPRRAGPSHVEVWWMRCEGLPTHLFEGWLTVLDATERARAERFRSAIDRETYIAAHMLTRTLLSHLAGRPAEQWRFAEADHGKPEIDRSLGVPSLRFNLSHTRGVVTCAAGFVDADIGVDVEAARRQGPSDLQDIAERFFAPPEVALLRNVTDAEAQRHTFLRIWTLKEAFIKATGEGLSRALDSFAFELDPIAVTVSGGDAGNWYFEQRDVTTHHVIAFAAMGGRGVRVLWRQVSAANLLLDS